MPKHTDWVRFTGQFLASFDFKKHHVTRLAFCEWARKERQPPLSISDATFGKMTQGQAVPKRHAQALVEYLNAKRLHGAKPPYALAAITEAYDPRLVKSNPLSELWDATRGDFLKHFLHLAKHLMVEESSFCQSDDEVADASEMLMHALGARNGHAKNREAAIAFAEATLQISLAEHTRFFQMIRRASPKSICFAILRRHDGQNVRAGASVVFACTKEAYGRLRSGSQEFFDLTAADIEQRGDHLIIFALTENAGLDLRAAKAERSMIQFKTVLNQFAGSCSPLPKANPRMLVFSPDGEGVQRSKSYHFREVGAQTPKTRLPILEFRSPKSNELDPVSMTALAHYSAMKSILVILQAVQSGQASSRPAR